MAANQMPEYAASSRKRYRETNDGNQAGDPDKAVAVILQAVDAHEAPLHLPLGPAAHAIAERKLAAIRSDIAADRKRDGEGKSVSVRVDLGGGRTLKKTKKATNHRKE